jgi:phage-related protein
MKPVKFVGSSRTDIRAFAADVRQEAGAQLRRVQNGFEPKDWKPMTSIGLGVKVIRIHTITESRVVYVAKFAEAIYVLHVFVKKDEKSNKRDIDLARRRFDKLVDERKS